MRKLQFIIARLKFLWSIVRIAMDENEESAVRNIVAEYKKRHTIAAYHMDMYYNWNRTASHVKTELSGNKIVVTFEYLEE